MTGIVYRETSRQVLVMLMLLMHANAFAVKNCGEGLFLHVIPETKEERCCIVVPIKRGEEFEICGKDGELDRVRQCPQGLYQPDDTDSSSEVTCMTPPQCIEGVENVESQVCRDGYCRVECICNVKAGKCGKFYYQCEDMPTDCPENKVHPNCSCVIKPQEASTVSSPGVLLQETVTRSDLNNRHSSKSTESKGKTNKGKKNKGKKRKEKPQLHMEGLEKDKTHIDSEMDKKEMVLEVTTHSQNKNKHEKKRQNKDKNKHEKKRQNKNKNKHEKKRQNKDKNKDDKKRHKGKMSKNDRSQNRI